MAWGTREWALVAEADWCVLINEAGERDGELFEQLELMLVNGREQIQVYFGPLVMNAPAPSVPENLPVRGRVPYGPAVSYTCGGQVKRGPLHELLGPLQEALEMNGEATIIADWRDQQALLDELRLRFKQPGKLSRPSALSERTLAPRAAVDYAMSATSPLPL